MCLIGSLTSDLVRRRLFLNMFLWAKYKLMGQFECAGGEEFEVFIDNSGTVVQNAERCASACAIEKPSWKGFILNGNGRCLCEEQDSSKCPRRIWSTWQRYDFVQSNYHQISCLATTCFFGFSKIEPDYPPSLLKFCTYLPVRDYQKWINVQNWIWGLKIFRSNKSKKIV